MGFEEEEKWHIDFFKWTSASGKRRSKMISKESSGLKIIRKSFGWIKRNLDPSRSYVIFENDIKKQGASIFSETIIAYRHLEKEKCPWVKVFDSDAAKEYLVIQVEPGNEEAMLGRVMGYGFPSDAVYYLFKAYV